MIDVNLTAPFFLHAGVRAAPASKPSGPGKVINISSVHEELPFPHFTPYCMSKGGLKMMMRNLAIELGRCGITVNNIAPGAIETPINRKLLSDPKLLNPLLENIPLHRIGKPGGRRVAGRVSRLRRMPTTSRAPPWWWTAACSGTTASNELPADRELRRDRRHALGGAGGQERLHRLVLPAGFRFAQRLRRDPGRPEGRRSGRSRRSVECTVRQMYLPDTNVLVTRFFTDEGMAEVIDFMPIGREAGGQTEQPSRQVIRIAKAIRGAIPFRMECRPAFDYARQPHEVQHRRRAARRDLRVAAAAVRAEGHAAAGARAAPGVVAEFIAREQPGGDVRPAASQRDGRPANCCRRRWTAHALLGGDGALLARLGRGRAATTAAGARW